MAYIHFHYLKLLLYQELGNNSVVIIGKPWELPLHILYNIY